jgi:DNA-binding winged helix-turn-helix (wHTH) protein
MSTEPGRQMVFGPLRFDPTTNQLWHGEQAVALQPKPLAVLHYLAARPGQVVPKQELLKAVWAGTYVTKAVLKVCVRAIREALGEEATAPQYLETVGREGYRFLGETSARGTAAAREEAPPGKRWVVGREQEVARLQGWLQKALNGERQIVFVTGELGIGKTTVVEQFLTDVRTAGRVSQVHRGVYRQALPTGFVRLPDSRVVKDPDQQVQHVLELLFAKFTELCAPRKSWGLGFYETKIVRHHNKCKLELAARRRVFLSVDSCSLLPSAAETTFPTLHKDEKLRPGDYRKCQRDVSTTSTLLRPTTSVMPFTDMMA